MDPVFLTRLESWTPLRAPYHTFFTEAEIGILSQAEQRYDDTQRQVVLCSFENRYASLGGLGSVIKCLPPFLAQNNERVIVVSPFYKRNRAIINAVQAGEITLYFAGVVCSSGFFSCRVDCYKQVQSGLITYFIDSEGFFEAEQHPYDYPDKNHLLDDSLAFCCALPFVLNKLDIRDHVLVHAHDWETAFLAVTTKLALLKNTVSSIKTILTLHNSYDASLPDGKLRHFINRLPAGNTVLQTSMPFLDGPLLTVSAPFARELMHDPLQTVFFADHLQRHFSKNPPIGIENGVFGPAESIFGEKKSVVTAIQVRKKKQQTRDELVSLLASSEDPRVVGKLVFGKCRKPVPVFFMSGRFDIMQKGFDVLFHAFSRLKPGSAKLIFSPSNPPDDPQSGYSFFTDCAARLPGDCTLWPFCIPSEQYAVFLSGSSFLVMPSLYEPFGAANEGFIHGTPVIARATGGLWKQVRPLYPCRVPVFYDDLFSASSPARGPNGILFRESGDGLDMAAEWRFIFSNLPGERIRSKLYQAMVDAAYKALCSAIELFSDQGRYMRIILNGIDAIADFNWQKTAQNYAKVYTCTARKKW